MGVKPGLLSILLLALCLGRVFSSSSRSNSLSVNKTRSKNHIEHYPFFDNDDESYYDDDEGSSRFSDDDNQIFYELDLNMDGHVDRLELTHLVGKYDPDKSLHEIERKLDDIFEACDRNKDNSISFAEYELAPQAAREALTKLAGIRYE